MRESLRFKLRALVAVIALALAAARTARADTTWVEGESAFKQGNLLTPPLRILDLADASSGSYIEVAPGNNSQATPPATGIASYPLFVANAGTYRIWARVIAPDTSGDSFWVRVNGGAWIKWNGIPLGNSWHWAQVKAEGASEPATFSLGNGNFDLLEVAYREDGAKLDVMVVTDDATFNPTSPPGGVPPAPQVAVPFGRGSARVNWSEVPGVASYTISRRLGQETNFTPIATGVVGHVFTQAGLPTDGSQVCYRVQGESSSGLGGAAEQCGIPNIFMYTTDVARTSLTSPMRITDTFTVSVIPGNNSPNAPPAAGRALYYFQTPLSTQLKVWGGVIAPDTSSDSFWVRMDGGTWYKWNNIRPLVNCFGFADVHDSDNGDRTVIFAVQPGSHTLEFAYREDGTELTGLVVWDDLTSRTPDCSD